MARKRAGKKQMPAEVEAKTTRPVRLDLPPDIHKLLRIVAAAEEMSMASYARDVIERHLRDESKRRGIKP